MFQQRGATSYTTPGAATRYFSETVQTLLSLSLSFKSKSDRLERELATQNTKCETLTRQLQKALQQNETTLQSFGAEQQRTQQCNLDLQRQREEAARQSQLAVENLADCRSSLTETTASVEKTVSDLQKCRSDLAESRSTAGQERHLEQSVLSLLFTQYAAIYNVNPDATDVIVDRLSHVAAPSSITASRTTTTR